MKFKPLLSHCQQTEPQPLAILNKNLKGVKWAQKSIDKKREKGV